MSQKSIAIDRSGLFKKFQNQWVALTGRDEVVGSGKTLAQALSAAKKKGVANPTVLRIPDLRYDYML